MTGNIDKLPKWAREEIQRLQNQVESLIDQLDRPDARKGDKFYVMTGYQGDGKVTGYKLDTDLHSVYIDEFQVLFNNSGQVEIRDTSHRCSDLVIAPRASNTFVIGRVGK